LDFEIHFCPNFSNKQDEKIFWQMGFGKQQTDLVSTALIWQISPHILGKFHQCSLRQIVDEILNVFFAKLCAPATFHRANKV